MRRPNMFRTVSRRPHSNLPPPGTSEPQQQDTTQQQQQQQPSPASEHKAPAEETTTSFMRRATLLMRSASASAVMSRQPTTSPKPPAEHGGVLEKQRANMRSWARRYCWVKDGRMLWAELKRDGDVGRERGGLSLQDVVSVERVNDAASGEAPSQQSRRVFVVKTEERTINFAAETDEEVAAWLEVLKPRQTEESLGSSFGMTDIAKYDDDDEAVQVLRRFPARLVRSEEVVVTVRSNLSVEVSKFVGGGFRLRLDELATGNDPLHVRPAEARAMGLGCDAPLCVVARGDVPWSAAETDGGACFLAMTDDEAKASWSDVLDEKRHYEQRRDGALHCRLAGWKLPDKWWTLFGANLGAPDEDNNEARTLLDALERWIAPVAILSKDDHRLRFPTRYAVPALALKDQPVLVNVTVVQSGRRATVRGVRCAAHDTVSRVAVELAKRIVDDPTLEQPPSTAAVSASSSSTSSRKNSTSSTASSLFLEATTTARGELLQTALAALLAEVRDDDDDEDRRRRRRSDTNLWGGAEEKKTWVFRVAGIRSYLVLRDAPLVASHDVVDALRSSTRSGREVDLVLELGLNDAEAAALQTAEACLGEWHGDLLSLDDAAALAFPVDQTAAALRARPPNVAKLERMPDALMEPYIPQLVQSLKADDADKEDDEGLLRAPDDADDDDFPGQRRFSRDDATVVAADVSATPEDEEDLGDVSFDDDDDDACVDERPATAAVWSRPTALMKFLLERALRNPTFVGSSLFWGLRCEMSKGGKTAVRHGAMLAAYLGAVGTRVRTELEKQVVLDNQLRWVTATCADFEDKHARNAFATRELRRLSRSGELPAGMDLPCMPGKRCGRVRPDSCRVLSSKAAPLLLVFDDDDDAGETTTTTPPPTDDAPPHAKTHVAIFKTRDDLRQDAAMLQAMRQMDALWLQAGIECWLRTYRVTATDVDVGWIEVVRDAKETSEIQSVWGSGSLGGAFQNDTLLKYLLEHNGDPVSFKASRERFSASCAACCVATYLLGIADRHNGNIMLHESGALFHIDFGHVLGNFKKIKAINVKRERTNLVLTPEMMFVINDGKNVSMNDDFVARCKSLIDILKEGRGNGALLHTLLAQLVPADLPEISHESIKWFFDTLLNNDVVAELNAALKDKFRRIDFAIHTSIHQGQKRPSAETRNHGASSGNSPSAPHNGRSDDRRRVHTIAEAQHEIEELRKLLSAAEAENKALAEQLAAAQQ
mmetsp:Transcript_19588/g.60564  ORF Transcript_19588/g.60564 Transcript_19588/m.60564 type:complete len:1226 (+) Transcript_19588:102-3779(+)